MKKFATCLAGLFLCLAIVQNATSDEKNVKMDEIIVSATRTEIATDRAGGNSITVITSDDIQAKQQNSVAELLKTVPGINITSTGGPGTATSVFIRGADSKNTLVLLDGIMLNDVSGLNRSPDLANINVDNIERIEVIRGPMSVMYGSNATAGVINIITKKGKKTPSASAQFEAGSYGTWKGDASLAGAVERINFAFSGSKTKTQGFSAANDDNDAIPTGDKTSEKDGYENMTISANAGIDITDNFSISGVLRHMDSDVDTDGYNWEGYAEDDDSNIESRQTFGKLDVNNTLFNNFLTSKFTWQGSQQTRDGFNDNVKEYKYDGDTRTFSWQGDLNFNSNTVSIGASYYEESMESESFGSWASKFDKKKVNTKSYWLQDQFSAIDNLIVIAGIRLDDHEEFGNKTTFRLAPSYTFPDIGTTLKASYGTGFRAPSLYELYDPYYGNNALDAEESDGWDLGFEQRLINDTITMGLTYFSMDYDNRIDYDFATSKYTQADGTTKTRGVEFFAGWDPLENIGLTLNYTYTDTEDPDGEPLARRPENKVAFNTRYLFLEKGTLNLDVQWVDDRKAAGSAMDKNGNPVENLDSYTLVNLAGSWQLNPHILLFGRIDNLFDEFYEEAFSYATAGLSAYGGIRLTF